MRAHSLDSLSWEALFTLMGRLGEITDRATFLDECLDVLMDILHADRGLILLSNPEGAPAVVNARSERRTLSVEERKEVSQTVLARAWRGEFVSWEPGAEDQSDSMARMGILQALAAPLQRPGWVEGQPVLGILYVDFRDPLTQVKPTEITIFRIAASFLALLIGPRGRVPSFA